MASFPPMISHEYISILFLIMQVNCFLVRRKIYIVEDITKFVRFLLVRLEEEQGIDFVTVKSYNEDHIVISHHKTLL
jgi:hypothetical protein